MREFFNQYPLGEKVIAAGVSGGADSLALVLRLKEWADAEGCRVVALTVDHRLRKESAEEAAYVSEVMARFGIEHHVLVWTDEKPENSIEEAAREARYRSPPGSRRPLGGLFRSWFMAFSICFRFIPSSR